MEKNSVIIKGTRIPVALIYELIGLKYLITEILEKCQVFFF